MDAVIFYLILLMIFVPGCLYERRRRARFREAFPPISDAEFIALCAPGTNPTVALKVRRTLAECLDVDYARIYPSSRLIQHLGAA
jgi:hypothetical protein